MSIVERAIKKLQVTNPASIAPARRTEGVATADITVPNREPAELGKRPVSPARPAMHIDRNALRAAGLLPPESQVRMLAGQYRQIKRPLIAAAFGRGIEKVDKGQFIMVASALPGEGKTFTCVNLALSMAMEKDTSVVLVDADVAKPHISHVLGLADRQGLLDCLEDDTRDVEALTLTTDIPGFHILPAGTRSETAPELLASVRMEQLAARLLAADPDRLILFDSPPLLLTNESRALAQVVGQVVVVVRAGFTLQSDVTAAIDLVSENKPIGLVLNQSVDEQPGRYYYGYGSSPESEGQTEPAGLQQK
jgi:protein-tyrosine kinase